MTRTNLDRYLASSSEVDMQRAIEDLVRMRNGRLWHVRNSKASPELVDLPDLLIADPKASRVIFAELKSQSRKVTPGQAVTLQLFGECTTFESGIVRPIPHPGEWSYDAFIEWLGGS